MGQQQSSEIAANERSAFTHYLRTGACPARRIEFKFNPYHDLANGQFTFGPTSGAARGRSVPTGQAGRRRNDPRDPGNYSVHVVQRGDTLATVAARRKGLRVSDLAWLNDVPADHKLTIGERLKLPNQAFLDSGRDAKNKYLALDYYMRTHGGRLPPDVANIPSIEEQILGPEQWNHAVANGYDFGIDLTGRTRQITGELSKNPTQGRSRRAQREAGGADRRTTDEGGHYVARRFNGPTAAFNHFAQDINFNRGRYRSLEDKLDKAKDLHKRVFIDITPLYEHLSKRPYSIIFRYKIDGVWKVAVFSNEGGKSGR
jgi:hypothetical protein